MVRHWFRKPEGEIPLQVRVLYPPPSHENFLAKIKKANFGNFANVGSNR